MFSRPICLVGLYVYQARDDVNLYLRVLSYIIITYRSV